MLQMGSLDSEEDGGTWLQVPKEVWLLVDHLFRHACHQVRTEPHVLGATFITGLCSSAQFGGHSLHPAVTVRKVMLSIPVLLSAGGPVPDSRHARRVGADY